MEPYYVKVEGNLDYLKNYVPTKQNVTSRVDSDHYLYM